MAKGHHYLIGFHEHVLVHFPCLLWAKKLHHIPLTFIFTDLRGIIYLKEEPILQGVDLDMQEKVNPDLQV